MTAAVAWPMLHARQGESPAAHLGTKAIAAAHQHLHLALVALDGGGDIQQQGLAAAAVLLGPVHDGDPLDGGGQGGQQVLGGPWPEQAHLE